MDKESPQAQKQQVDIWGLIAGLSIISFLLSLVFAGVFISQGDLAKHCKKVPSNIKAIDLAKSGPPADNWHVLISDYKLDEVITESKGASITSLSCDVIPVPPSAQKIHQLKLTNYLVNNEQEVYDFLQQKTFDGIAFPVSNDEINIEVKIIQKSSDLQTSIILCGSIALLSLGLIVYATLMSKKQSPK